MKKLYDALLERKGVEIEKKADSIVDSMFNGITNELGIDVYNDKMEKSAGGITDALSVGFLETIPYALFSIPFSLGGAHYLMGKDLRDQERKHNEQMYTLRKHFPNKPRERKKDE